MKHFSFADENFINSVIEPNHLVERVPRLETFFEGVQEMKDLQARGSTYGAHNKVSGFTPGRQMQRIATIPYSIAAAILEVDPEFFTDRGKVYRFLSQHPEYDTRTRG